MQSGLAGIFPYIPFGRFGPLDQQVRATATIARENKRDNI